MQGGVAQMKLSVIAGHHTDPMTDRLYQPLRVAIQHIDAHRQAPASFKTELKHSMLPNKIQQHKIKESTMFLENMKLVETNNPLKRIRARSKSYRAISVEETFGRPLNSRLFREQIKVHPVSKREVVYDYEPDGYQPEVKQAFVPPVLGPARVRSATLISPLVETLGNRVERVESTTMQVNRKPPTNNTSSTSIRIIPQAPGLNVCVPQIAHVRSERELRPRGTPDFSSQYYQNCNKYTFNHAFKANTRRQPQPEGRVLLSPQSPERSGRSNSNYKYNLFSMMDEQANLNCQNGFCTKNEVVASRIKKRW